jgi:protease I
MTSLKGKQVLICAGPDFEDRELFYPLYRFKEAEATVKVAGLGEKVYKGKYGVPVTVDGNYEDFTAQKWDLIVVPGGWAPDKMRMNKALLSMIRKTLEAGGVVSAICHGGWVLTSADVVRDVKVTSYIAIKDDMVHAGGQWVDEAVVVAPSLKGHIVTSRTPDDLPPFCQKLVELLAKAPVLA